MERRLITANEVVKRTVRWLWAGRIPCGAITILEGDPGIGKSVLTYDLAARITSGRPMPGCTESMPSAGAVLLQAEDSLSGTVIPNLQAAGADLQKVILLDKDRFATQQFSLSSDLPLVEKAIVEVEAKFVVIDPLTAFFETNTNADVSVRRILGPLTRLAERYELAILLVRHLRKSGAKNSLYSGAGSIGIIAAARSGLVVGHDPSSDNKYQQVLALNKSNMADASSLSFQTVKQPDGAITIEWLGASQYSANDINAAASLAEEHPILREAMYVLYAILSEGSIPAIEVMLNMPEFVSGL
jgi:RecA-family ATPase